MLLLLHSLKLVFSDLYFPCLSLLHIYVFMYAMYIYFVREFYISSLLGKFFSLKMSDFP